MPKRMIVIFYTAIIILFVSSVIYLWKNQKFTLSEWISISALVITLIVTFFAFVVKVAPAKILVSTFDFGIGRVPEENKNIILRDILWQDINASLSDQGKRVKSELVKQFSLRKFGEEEKDFVFKQKININYDAPTKLIEERIGRLPVPIICGVSFVNESPSQVVIDEVFLTAETNSSKILFKPWFEIDATKFYTNKFEKLNDILSTPFHSFLLLGNSEKKFHLFFIKDRSFNLSGKEDKNIELPLGDITFTLHINYGGIARKFFVQKLNLDSKMMINAFNGGGFVNYQTSKFYDELIETLTK